MKRKLLIGLLGVALVGTLVALLVNAQQAQPSVDVVGGSAFISNIIHDVSDGKLEARPLVQPGMCPGHHDVKPSDIRALESSKALIVHNYQQGFPYISQLVEAAQNPGLVIEVIDIMGNWMAPPIQAEAVNKIASFLGEIDPENAAHYQDKATERVQAILAKGEEVRSRLQEAGVEEVKVICNEMQAGFVNWAGFDIVAAYGRPEDLSAAKVEQLIVDAREAGVALVIDNLQSGATATSAAMAQDIEAVQVTISNFPGGFADTATWEKSIDRNVELLLAALNEWEEQYG